MGVIVNTVKGIQDASAIGSNAAGISHQIPIDYIGTMNAKTVYNLGKGTSWPIGNEYMNGLHGIP